MDAKLLSTLFVSLNEDSLPEMLAQLQSFAQQEFWTVPDLVQSPIQ